MINILIAIAILLIYTIVLCIANKQIPSSLSATVFYLPPKGAWIWTLVIAAVVFLIAPTYISIMGESWQWLAFLSCAGLLFVAGAPLVKDKSDMAYKVHMAGAILCAVSSQVSVAVVEPKLLLLWVFWVFTWAWITKDNGGWRTKTFWAEMVCFTTTFVMVLIS